MPTRDVWRMDRAGSLGDLRREREDLAPPGAGEARVRVEAIGLNFADVFSCLALYSATPRGPFIPGLECAGTVEAIGDGVRASGVAGTEVPALPPHGREVPALHSHRLHSDRPGVALGDRVMVLTRFGGFATAINADTRYLLRTPDAWSSDEAAAFPVQAMTAWYGLVRLGRWRRTERAGDRGSHRRPRDRDSRNGGQGGVPRAGARLDGRPHHRARSPSLRHTDR
jgi:NADPH:quinone reductase-like Zn-dependent oxidoreductase